MIQKIFELACVEGRTPGSQMSFTSFALLFVILLLPPTSSPVEEPYPQVAGEINR